MSLKIIVFLFWFLTDYYLIHKERIKRQTKMIEMNKI